MRQITFYSILKLYFMYSESEGIDKLRTGSLILMFASIFIIVAFYGLLSLLLSLPISPTAILSIFGIINLYSIIMRVIGFGLIILGLYYIEGGFKALSELNIGDGTGHSGARLAYYAIGAAIIAFAWLGFPILGVIVFSLFELVSFIIGFISSILIGIGFYKLGGVYDESLVKIGGILVIFIPLIGYILTYYGLGKISYVTGHSSLTNIITRTITLPSQPQIYQVGQGTIRSNGIAKITLYSPTQATILSAKIDGTKLTSVNISPAVLPSGHTEVTIQFNDISSLIPYTIYQITLTVNIGGNITEIKTNASY